jgi:hypothetical protein
MAAKSLLMKILTPRDQTSGWRQIRRGAYGAIANRFEAARV